MSARILVGTSSWADPGFVEEWYPGGPPARDRLPYHAERFGAVEAFAPRKHDLEDRRRSSRP